MLYIFYPYFWGNKEDWVTISQITDDDPLYTRFLQAGAARGRCLSDRALKRVFVFTIWPAWGFGMAKALSLIARKARPIVCTCPF